MPEFADFHDPAIETMPRDKLLLLQEARLERILAHAYENAPLIHQTWRAAGLRPQDIRSSRDFFERAPFISKDAVRQYRDMHNDPCGGMKAVADAELKYVGSTSGTTGDPTPVPAGLPTVPEVGYVRDHWHMGVRPGDYFANIMFTFRSGHARTTWSDLGIIPIVFSLTPAEVPRLFEALKRYRPTGMSMFSMPFILAFEQVFERGGYDPNDIFQSLKGVVFGGEPLAPRLKALTESWGLELFETTSLGDICGATECRAHDGMHAWQDLALVECLDPAGDRPMRDGEIGEMVVTSLADRFMPLIRYRTDDLITMTREPCSCGRTHPRIRPIGRKGDQILVEGRVILPRHVHRIVETVAETRAGLFQVVRSQAQMDSLRVRIGYDPDLLRGSPEDLSGRLYERITTELEVPVTIELVPNDDLLKLGPPHKIPRVTKQ